MNMRIEYAAKRKESRITFESSPKATNVLLMFSGNEQAQSPKNNEYVAQWEMNSCILQKIENIQPPAAVNINNFFPYL